MMAVMLIFVRLRNYLVARSLVNSSNLTSSPTAKHRNYVLAGVTCEAHMRDHIEQVRGTLKGVNGAEVRKKPVMFGSERVPTACSEQLHPSLKQ